MSHGTSIIDKIPGLEDNLLLQLFENARSIVQRCGVHAPEARDVISAINDEWLRRQTAAAKNQYVSDRPREGMLAVLGYHVGQNAMSSAKRHAILDRVISEELPFVHSPAYISEWGEPLSQKRFSKLKRTIENSIFSKANMSNIDKAVIEWQEDLDYIKEKWNICADKVKCLTHAAPAG